MLAAVTEEKAYRKAMEMKNALPEIQQQIVPEIYEVLQEIIKEGE